jgi:enterochelin esterase-like enzyme
MEKNLKIKGQSFIKTIIWGLMVLFFSSNCSNNDKHDDLNFDLSQYKEGTIDTTQVVSSSILNRDMHYSVYLPPEYNDTSKYPILYLLHGMWGNYKDWVNNGLAATLDDAINKGTAKKMIVVMPDGLDAFYCNNYDDRKLRYEDFMMQEFIPTIEKKYRVNNIRKNRAIAGLSMGGYGAAFYSFKYSNMFCCGYSMSGALLGGGNATPDIRAIIDAKTTEELAMLPVFTMECGTEDNMVYSANVEFDAYLTQKGIEHTFISRSGSHDWTFWKACLPKALTLVSKQFD